MKHHKYRYYNTTQNTGTFIFHKYDTNNFPNFILSELFSYHFLACNAVAYTCVFESFCHMNRSLKSEATLRPSKAILWYQEYKRGHMWMWLGSLIQDSKVMFYVTDLKHLGYDAFRRLSTINFI